MCFLRQFGSCSATRIITYRCPCMPTCIALCTASLDDFPCCVQDSSLQNWMATSWLPNTLTCRCTHYYTFAISSYGFIFVVGPCALIVSNFHCITQLTSKINNFAWNIWGCSDRNLCLRCLLIQFGELIEKLGIIQCSWVIELIGCDCLVRIWLNVKSSLVQPCLMYANHVDVRCRTWTWRSKNLHSGFFWRSGSE